MTEEGATDVFPGAPELCDTIDQDCNGIPDDTYAVDAQAWYLDLDYDRYGAMTYAPRLSCTQIGDRVTNAEGCDDTNIRVNPAAQEVCDPDDVDEDCDGMVDEADDSAPPLESSPRTSRSGTLSPSRSPPSMASIGISPSVSPPASDEETAKASSTLPEPRVAPLRR